MRADEEGRETAGVKLPGFLRSYFVDRRAQVRAAFLATTRRWGFHTSVVEAAGVEGWLPGSARARPAVVEPLAPGRYRVQFTASAELHDELERLRALMRPSVPDGDLGAIVEQAVTEKLQRLEARRFARTQAPRKTLSQSETSPTTRQVPAAVERAVYERDGGRCRYEDEQGRRCTARQGLEFHHRRPFGHGGDHSVAKAARRQERYSPSATPDRAHPEDDPEHGQERAQRVAAQARKARGERLARVDHRPGSAPLAAEGPRARFSVGSRSAITSPAASPESSTTREMLGRPITISTGENLPLPNAC